MLMSGLDILVIAAHPDDAEIGMGGTIAKHCRAGYRVAICDLTEAELSSNGTPELRSREAALSGQRLGIASRLNLQLPDRGLRNERQQVDVITSVIRETRPRLVFAPYWIDRHPDHVACSKLVEEAVFNAKLRRYPLDGEPHHVEQLYYYYIHELPQADVVIDISADYEVKMQALEAYRSQFVHIDNEETVATPLNQGYLEQVRERDRLLGRRHEMQYAEGFACKTAQRRSLFLD
jgi:bacillithiol biosynthesis deacetylase BshB1